MILVDDQSGSKDLFPYVNKLTTSVLLTRIDPPFGDIAWYGNGPEGPLRVGVEYKTIDDVLDCIDTGRLAGHQIIGMTQNYDRRYLLVEGRIRVDRDTGIIQKWRADCWQDILKQGRGFLYRDLEHWYTTLEEQAQFRVVKTFDKHESARWVWTKYTWYTKEWSDHTALQKFYVAPLPNVVFTKPGVIRRVANQLSNIGWDKSITVEARFKSVREMINANEQTWAGIDGIGKTISHRIVAEVSEERK